MKEKNIVLVFRVSEKGTVSVVSLHDTPKTWVLDYGTPWEQRIKKDNPYGKHSRSFFTTDEKKAVECALGRVSARYKRFYGNPEKRDNGAVELERQMVALNNKLKELE